MKLINVCNFINGGAWKEKEYASYGIPVVQVSNMKNGTINISDLKYLSQTSYDRYKKHSLKVNDLIIATVGSHSTQESAAGRATIVKEFAAGMFLNQNAVVIRSKSKLMNQGYLGLIGRSKKFQAYLGTIGQGAANQVRIALSGIKKFDCNLPPIEDQRRIANIISDYDDLINVNRRRIQLLEESARLLFREWFVYFRFPGYEKVKIVDRNGRKMPSDWDYLPFTKIKIFKKATLGVPVFTDIRQYYQTSEIDGTTITGDGEEVDYENRPSRANIAPAINTIYFAKMKDTDKVLYFNEGNSFLLEKILLSTGMVGFTTDEKYLGFLFSLLKSYEFVQYKNNFATGATQVSLNNASLKKIKVLFPKLNLVELYSEIVNPLLEKCSLLKNQNQKLAQARDLLLPRLMSGEIEV